MLLFTYVRLAHGFSDYKTRLKSVQARLQALFGEPAVLKHSRQGNTYTVTLRLPRRSINTSNRQSRNRP